MIEFPEVSPSVNKVKSERSETERSIYLQNIPDDGVNETGEEIERKRERA